MLYKSYNGQCCGLWKTLIYQSVVKYRWSLDGVTEKYHVINTGWYGRNAVITGW